MTTPTALAAVQNDHPCLWGAIATTPAAPLVTARHARLIPTRPTGMGLQDRVALIQREIRCNHLITAEVLYRDRGFVSVDFPVAARQALNPQLRQRLLARTHKNRRIAYLSRH